LAKTLLNGVNDVMKRLGYIKGNSGELTSIVDSQRQVTIDLVIQSWNEVIVEIYDASDAPLPNELAENTITLVTDDRDYTLQADLVQLRWPFTNQTNGNQIFEYPGGYEQIYADQPIPSNFIGQPTLGTIRPIDGQLYLDRLPTAELNGDVYTYQYDKELLLSAATDLMPFEDTVFSQLIMAVAELAKRDKEKSFDGGMYARRTGIAAGLLTKQQQRRHWTPIRGTRVNVTDPLEGIDASSRRTR